MIIRLREVVSHIIKSRRRGERSPSAVSRRINTWRRIVSKVVAAKARARLFWWIRSTGEGLGNPHLVLSFWAFDFLVKENRFTVVTVVQFNGIIGLTLDSEIFRRSACNGVINASRYRTISAGSVNVLQEICL
jgi:hypothetical protein